MDVLTEEPALLRFLDRLVSYWEDAIRGMIDAGVDVIMFADDWGTQDAPLISPALFRRIFLPRYELLMAPVREAGRRVFFHSCGFLGGTLADLVGLGIDGLWPQITPFDSDPSYLEACTAHQVTVYIHPDRQYLVPKGTPEEIETTVKQYAERHHSLRGGGIFHVEIENDAPFENVEALVRAIDKWR
jgi:uroporphyrinogen decarboxylase